MLIKLLFDLFIAAGILCLTLTRFTKSGSILGSFIRKRKKGEIFLGRLYSKLIGFYLFTQKVQKNFGKVYLAVVAIVILPNPDDFNGNHVLYFLDKCETDDCSDMDWNITYLSPENDRIKRLSDSEMELLQGLLVDERGTAQIIVLKPFRPWPNDLFRSDMVYWEYDAEFNSASPERKHEIMIETKVLGREDVPLLKRVYNHIFLNTWKGK
jgi:hypothetical protein